MKLFKKNPKLRPLKIRFEFPDGQQKVIDIFVADNEELKIDLMMIKGVTTYGAQITTGQVSE